MKTVVVYFSRDNNTRLGAEILGERLDAKVVELKEAKKGNFIQALMKKGSIIQGEPWREIESAESVYVMSPIWASHDVPAMNAFLDKADFTGKEVTIVTFKQFEDLRGSDKVHRQIREQVEGHGGKVVVCHALMGGKIGHCAGIEAISREIDRLF